MAKADKIRYQSDRLAALRGLPFQAAGQNIAPSMSDHKPKVLDSVVKPELMAAAEPEAVVEPGFRG